MTGLVVLKRHAPWTDPRSWQYVGLPFGGRDVWWPSTFGILMLNQSSTECHHRVVIWYVIISSYQAPPSTFNSNETLRDQIPSYSSLIIGVFIQDEAVGVDDYVPQATHYQANVIYLLPQVRLMKEQI